MGKKRSRSQKQVVERATGNRGRILAIGLLISLLVGGAVFAQRGFFAMRKPQPAGNAVTPTASPAPMPTNPASPSKEYIYAGGRLIATEEPTAAPPPTCNYSLSAQSLPTFSPGGGPSTLTVNASSGCSWTVAASSWITINSGSGGTGGGSISFTVQSNPDSTFRSGGITVTGTGTSPATTLTCNISQSGSSCIFTLTPTAQGLTYPVKNDNTVTVLTGPGCVWTAVSTAGWITIISPTNNVTGGGTVTYSVTANTSGISRQGIIKIAGKDFPVTQSPQPPPGTCTYALSPTSKNFPATGGSGTTSLTTQGGCGWSVGTASSWITITSPATGSGTTSVVYTVAANTSSQQRTGLIAIYSSAGNLIQNFTVTEDGVSGGTGTGTGLRGEYYTYNNPNLPTCGTLALTRTDPTVDFDWQMGSFSPSFSQNIDYFMARWTGQVEAPITGLVTFYARTDDGVRLWVNNQLLIDQWYPQFGHVWPGSIQLTAGQRYDIRMEMYEATGGAEAHLWWQYASLSQPQIVPTTRLYPYATPQPLYEGATVSSDICSTAVSGWALDRRQSNTAINVGIYVDGSATPTATVAANQSRPDLIICPGENGLHGFSWTIPASLKNGVQHTIQVKYGSTSINLGLPVQFTCTGSSAPPPLTTAPTATPTSASSVNLQWSYSGTTQTGFVIQRRDGSTGAFADIVTLSGANLRSTTDSGLGSALSSGHTYCYKVIPFNGAGRAADPNLFGCATIQGTASGPPAAPSGLGATFSDSPRGVNLTWNDNSNNETSFKIWRRSRKTNNPTGWSSYGSAPITTRTANTVSYFDNSTLVAGMTYGYVVQASNSSGDSAFSNEAQVSVTTPPSSPCVGVNSLSGSGSYGYVDATGDAAQWAGPSASASGIDPVSGLNALFVADTENNLIRMVYLDGPAAGSSVLIAGCGQAGYYDNDDGYQAWFNRPQGIAAIKNESGVVQSLLVADTDNNIIRQLLPPVDGGHWRTSFFAGNMDPGGGSVEGQLTFNSPHGIALGLDGMIYVADTGNCEICMLNQAGYGLVWYQDPDAGFALGTGQMIGFQPVSLAINEVTGQIYLTDEFYDEIDEMTTGSRVTLAGSHSAGYADGVGTAAAFDLPQSLIWADSDTGGSLVIADANNNRLRMLDLGTNTVTTWAGSGTAGNVNAICTAAQFNSPTGLTVGVTGQVYVVDLSNNSIRSVQ